ncbi:MAG: hypothetical protein CMM59_12020 [Rhodospirillaceae bacterium]|nr:hypothetical protein [Rhodospirillaceae bacterium]
MSLALRARNGLGIFAIMIAAGCALTDTSVTLKDRVATQLPPAATERVFAFLPMEDIRTSKTKVGAVRNGHGTHTANALTTNDGGKWVYNSMIKSLRRAGYKISQIHTRAEAPVGASVISSRLYRIYADPDVRGLSVGATGEVQALFRVENGGMERTSSSKGQAAPAALS